MTPKITPEMREALKQKGQPLAVEDDETHEIYLLVSQQGLPSLWDDFIRREVQRGVAQLDRGESAEWNVDAFLEEAHRHRAAGKQ